MLQSFPRQIAMSTRVNVNGGFGCFNPEKAKSAAEVCELYQQALKERAMAIIAGGQALPVNSVCKRLRADTEETVADNLSVDSGLGFSDEASEDGTYLSDIDSVAMRRRQINPSASDCPCQEICMEYSGLDIEEEVSILDVLDIDENLAIDDDLDSDASSEDTHYSLDVDSQIQSLGLNWKLPWL